MPDFWDNILRFPRFFLSSTLGLLIIIIGPFFNLLRNPKTSILFLVVIISIFGFTIITLQAMLGISTT